MGSVPLPIARECKRFIMSLNSSKLAQELAIIDKELAVITECISSGMRSLLSLLDKDNILNKSKKDIFGYDTQNRENKYLRDRLVMLRKDSIRLEKLINARADVKREYEYAEKVEE